MARLTWDKQGQRLYHTGIDRGVLYLDEGVVAPWSGLVSVTESPSGGQPTETYLDGQKILNVGGGEDYAATIESLSLPLAAAGCAGWGILQVGLYASHQNKSSFSLSYRTLIGNDLDGTNFGYQLHIVFGAIAKNADFAHETNSDKPSAKTYSWEITAVPVSFGLVRPTAHVIFDTRYVDSTTMGTVEAILYGDDSNDPRLLSPAEIALLTSTAQPSSSASGSLLVVDNGDGSWSVTSLTPGVVEMLDGNTFQIDDSGAMFVDGSTYTITSL